MAVAFGNGAGQLSEFEVEATITSVTTTGSDRVGIACYGGWSDAATVTATWGGVGTTRIGTSHAVDAVQVDLFYIIAPATGSSSVVFTSSDQFWGAVGWSYYTGAHQTTPITDNGTDGVIGGETMSVALSSASGDMGVDVAAGSFATPSSPLGTQIFNVGAGAAPEGASEYRASTGSTVTMGWTVAGEDCAMIAANIAQAAGGGGTILPFMNHYH